MRETHAADEVAAAAESAGEGGIKVLCAPPPPPPLFVARPAYDGGVDSVLARYNAGWGGTVATQLRQMAQGVATDHRSVLL